MKLVKPSVEILEQEDLFKHIELCARTCYKSEDKITDDSAVQFVERLIKSGHCAMLEHGTVYLYFKNDMPNDIYDIIERYKRNDYSELVTWWTPEKDVWQYYITTNYRVLVENDWLDDLRFQTEPTKYHNKRISVKFVCDRGVSHELVRHRVFSFAQESTRYCNYSKDKFDNEITFIQPCWYTPGAVSSDEFRVMLEQSEENYFRLLNFGWQPQQARAVLPNALKTEIVMTGFLKDWFGEVRSQYKTGENQQGMTVWGTIIGYPDKWSEDLEKIVKEKCKDDVNRRVEVSGFFPLRIAQSAHPQMRELAIPLYEMFKERKLKVDFYDR